MPAFFSYQFAIRGTQTVNGSGNPVSYVDEPPSGTWSYSGDFSPFIIEQANDTATSLIGDPFFFDETILGFIQSGSANAQEVDVEGGPKQLIWDYTFQVQDPNTLEIYNIAVLDVDLSDNDAIEGADENGYFLIFENGLPPPDTDLTILPGTVANGILRSHEDLGGEVVCFVAGTLIDTPDGPRAVETLKEGELVSTRDAGPQPLRWTGRTHMFGYGKSAPVVVPTGALGNETELVVSPQHAILIESWQAELLYGTQDVLVRAVDLVGYEGIHRREGGVVSYHHVLFDRHQLVRAAGIWSESLYPGDVAIQTISAKAQQEIRQLVPDIESYGPKAAPYLRSFEAACLAA